MDVIKYGSSFDEGKRYGDDLRYWCNACGELHHWGQYNITEEDLPGRLRDMYNEIWEESPYGNYCYLVEYKGEYGIALINEYYEYEEKGVKSANNYEQAEKVAQEMSMYSFHPVLLAKEQGFPKDDEAATEVVIFLRSGSVNKKTFNEIAKYFSEIAYK